MFGGPQKAAKAMTGAAEPVAVLVPEETYHRLTCHRAAWHDQIGYVSEPAWPCGHVTQIHIQDKENGKIVSENFRFVSAVA